MTYSPGEYWSSLLARGDLSAVGQSALPAEINRWLYRALARNVGRFVRRHGLARPAPAAVFDVGSGTGYWLDYWRRIGVPRVDGCDLVPAAVERLRADARRSGRPDELFVADISVAGSLPARTYPLVSCFNVLLHLTDDAAFERGLRNVAGLVAPGGHLLLVEPIVLREAFESPFDPAKHSRARAVARYVGPLRTAGLELVELAPATVLANNPIEAGSPAGLARLRRWWRFVAGRSKRDPGSARWLGPLVLILDWLAMTTGAAPTSKIALFHRLV